MKLVSKGWKEGYFYGEITGILRSVMNMTFFDRTVRSVVFC